MKYGLWNVVKLLAHNVQILVPFRLCFCFLLILYLKQIINTVFQLT